jgi:hypothetical protein
MTSQPAASVEQLVQLVIKSPTRQKEDAFSITVPRSDTVGILKVRLQKAYPDRPHPEAITLIYGGKVLKDSAVVLGSVLPEDQSVATLHMVVRPGNVPSMNASGPSVASADLAGSLQANFVSDEHALSEPQGAVSSSGVHAVHAPLATNGGHTIGPEQNPVVRVRTAAHDDSRNRSVDEASHVAPADIGGAASSSMPESDPPSAFDAAINTHLYNAAYTAAYHAALRALVTPTASSFNGGMPREMPADVNAAITDAAPQPVAAPMVVPVQVIAMPVPIAYQVVPRPPALQFGMQPARAEDAPHMVQHAGPQDGPALAELIAHLHRLEQHGVLDPQVRQLLRMMEARAEGVPPEAPRRRQLRLRIRINMRALLQLLFMLVVVYQHCPPKRFLALVVAGVALYLTTTPRVRAMLQQLMGLQGRAGAQAAPPNHGVRVGGPQAEAAAPQPQAHGPAGQGGHADVPPVREGDGGGDNGGVRGANVGAQQLGVLQQIHAFVAGFLASLLPALDPVAEGPAQPVF